jgi:hypothetical protein
MAKLIISLEVDVPDGTTPEGADIPNEITVHTGGPAWAWRGETGGHTETISCPVKAAKVELVEDTPKTYKSGDAFALDTLLGPKP